MNASKPARPDSFFGRKLTIRHFLTARRMLAVGVAAMLIAIVSLGAKSATTGDHARLRETCSDDRRPVDPQTLARQDLGTQALVVQVETAREVDSFTASRTYTGLVVASRTSQLGFERSARVIELRVDVGDTVAEGDVMGVLDGRQLETERQRLEAQRDQAAAVLAELRAGPRVETIAAAKAEVHDWAAQLELQRRNYARTTELVVQQAVSRERHDEAELGVQSLQAKLDAAQKRLEELEAGTRTERIVAQEAIVKQLDASLDDLAIEIEDSTLLAPFDGVISQRHVDEGTVVSPAQPIYEIVERGDLEAEIGLPPRAFARLVEGQEVEIQIGDRKWPSKFDRASAIVELRTRTRTAIFELDRTACEIVVPGEVARVALAESTAMSGFWVNTRALIRNIGGLWALYVAEPPNRVEADRVSGGATVSRRDVEVLHTEAERSFVRGLIQPGDQIIVSGTQRVVPGQNVRAVPVTHSP